MVPGNIGPENIMGKNNYEKDQLPQHEDTPAEPYYDLIATLKDGTEAVKIGEVYYPLKKNGKLDFDRPIRDLK